MPIYTFTGLQLRNADNSIAPNATVQIFARGDTSFSTPLEPLDMSETTVLPGVTSDWNGDVPPFKVNTDVAAIVAYAEGYQKRPIASVDELVDGVAVAVAAATEVHGLATQARDTAVTAASSAAGAEAAAVALAPDGGAKAVGKGELVVNVRDFGAVGDGVADDTAALRAWLDHLVANGGEGYLPPGVYRVTSSLVRTDMPPPLRIRGAGSSQSILYGDFIGPGEGILGVDVTLGQPSGHHQFQGLGFQGNGVPGDPIGLLLTFAFECQVEDINSRHDIPGTKALANSILVVTDDNNSKYRNIRSQGGWQPKAFDISNSTAFAFTSGSTTVTASTPVFTGAMVGKPIYFSAGSDTGPNAIWRANITAISGDGLSCTIDQGAPSTASGVFARVGYVTGTVADNSTSLVLNDVVGLSSAYVGMQVHVLGAGFKADALSTIGTLSTHITAVAGNTVTLAAPATEAVTNAIVLFCPALFIGRYEEETVAGAYQQTNHSWWSNVQLEGFAAAGLIVNNALYLVMDKVKFHGSAYTYGDDWGECYYWAIFSEIKGVAIKDINGSYGVAGSKILVHGSRGILEIKGLSAASMYKDVPMLEVSSVAPEFTLDLADISVAYALTNFSPGYQLVSSPRVQNVEYSGAVQIRSGANRLSQAGPLVRRGITGTRGKIIMADDTVYMFKPEGMFGLLHIASSALSVSGIVWYRTSAYSGGAAATELTTSANLSAAASMTDLTGTTGTDGQVTVACDSQGNVRIENRRGFVVDLALVCAPFGE